MARMVRESKRGTPQSEVPLFVWIGSPIRTHLSTGVWLSESISRVDTILIKPVRSLVMEIYWEPCTKP